MGKSQTFPKLVDVVQLSLVNLPVDQQTSVSLDTKTVVLTISKTIYIFSDFGYEETKYLQDGVKVFSDDDGGESVGGEKLWGFPVWALKVSCGGKAALMLICSSNTFVFQRLGEQAMHVYLKQSYILL